VCTAAGKAMTQPCKKVAPLAPDRAAATL
jgi:hypothetical protein